MARGLLLCRCSGRRDTKGVELAYLQFMECVPPLDAVDETLGCACLQSWKASCGQSDTRVSSFVKKNGIKMVEEWFEAIYFQYYACSSGIQCFVFVHYKGALRCQRVYDNRVFKDSAMKRN